MMSSNVHKVKKFEVKPVEGIDQETGRTFYIRRLVITDVNGETFDIAMLADDKDDLAIR